MVQIILVTILQQNKIFLEDQLPIHRKTRHYIFLDEVGRGCLAGPVVVGGCLWTPSESRDYIDQSPIASWQHLRTLGVKDSKKVPEKKRPKILEDLRLDPLRRQGESLDILGDQFVLCVDQNDVDRIEKINILAATLELMAKVSLALLQKAQITEGDVSIIVDGREKIPGLHFQGINFHQLAIPKSDVLFAPTGLASLYAKVYRDHQMDVWNVIYPDFDLGKHKGYGTAKHLESIKKHGPSPIHRRTFAGVKEHFLN